MEKAFRKDLSHLSWDEVYARQASRAALIPDWLNALQLKPGDRVLEIGAGPGFVSFALADRVGPTGVVYALDRSVARRSVGSDTFSGSLQTQPRCSPMVCRRARR